MGGITTGDYYIECLVQAQHGGEPNICAGKFTNSATSHYILSWDIGAAPQRLFYVHRSGTQINVFGTIVTADEEWVWLSLFGDRDENHSVNGFRMYLNNAIDKTANISTAQGSLNTTSAPWTFGGPGDDTYVSQQFAREIAYFQVWERADWFAGGAQNVTDFDAAAAERFAIAQP